MQYNLTKENVVKHYLFFNNLSILGNIFQRSTINFQRLLYPYYPPNQADIIPQFRQV